MLISDDEVRTMCRVVIAEDDFETRSLMRLALRHMSCHILEVGSGLELLEAIAYDGPFDLIVTDIAMPHIDGVRVIAMARNAGVNTPILVVSAHVPEDTTAAWLGEVKILRKPFGLQALRQAVTSLLEVEAPTTA